MKIIILFVFTQLCFAESCIFCNQICKKLDVVNGLPGPEMIEMSKRNEIILGGCMGRGEFGYYCNKCDAQTIEGIRIWHRSISKDYYKMIIPNEMIYIHGIGEESYRITVFENNDVVVRYYNTLDSELTKSDFGIDGVTKILWPKNKPQIFKEEQAGYNTLSGALDDSGYVECENGKYNIKLTVERRPRMKYIRYEIYGIKFEDLIKIKKMP